MPQPSSRERAREIVAATCRKVDVQVGAYDETIDAITAAIDAAVAEEREACAKVAEDFVQVVGDSTTQRQHWYKIAAKRVASKIRARGAS